MGNDLNLLNLRHKEEIAELEAAFRKADINGDGKVISTSYYIDCFRYSNFRLTLKSI